MKIIKKYKVLFISIFIALLIEIFIFNFSYFRTLLNGNINCIKDYKINEDNSITISNINERVTSIYFDYYNKLTDKVTYNINYTSEENSFVSSLNQKVILPNENQFVNFDTHSKCKEINIKILTDSQLKIKNIILNYPNFNMNFWRVLILIVFFIFLQKLKNGSLYEKYYDANSKEQNGIFVINLLVICSIFFVYGINQLDLQKFFINANEIPRDDSILLQTEAFMNGKIELMVEPSRELKEMENPYDNIKRDAENIDYLYDVAFYNNNYYNYFGIAPIITSILPFRLITGMYTHTCIFNIFYIFIAIVSLGFLYKKIVNRYIKKISLFNFYLGFYTILFASNIFTLLRGLKYDIVVSSGIAFLLISINLVLSIYDNKKYKYIKLICLGITTALIVLSKPNLIVYYLIIAFFLIVFMKGKTKKENIINIFCILVPLGIFAIFQMFFNYLRFGNIFEFGAKYQLTGFNMNYCMSITFGKIYAGIVEYIFKMPVIKPLVFPFVFPNTDISAISINEICYENRWIS